MNIGKMMLDKLEGNLTPAELSEQLSDAYSFGAYKNGWIPCIKMLRKRKYLDSEIEIILRSKFTRWARDCSNNRYGSNSANDLAKYMDKNKESLEDLLK